MHPTVEIVRNRNGRYSFAVERSGTGDWYVRDGLVSITACIQKAAAALGGEFKFATIAYGVLRPEREHAANAPPRALRHAAANEPLRRQREG